MIDLGDAVAVTADSSWIAARALEDLAISWEGGLVNSSSASIRTQLAADLTGGEV